MSRESSPSGISPSEWSVMAVLWEASPGKELTAAEVFAKLGESTRWKQKTVSTFLERLVDKGAIESRKVSGTNRYQAILARRDAVRQEASGFVERVFSGLTAPAVLHFVEEGQLSKDEIARLKQKLEELTDEHD